MNELLILVYLLIGVLMALNICMDEEFESSAGMGLLIVLFWPLFVMLVLICAVIIGIGYLADRLSKGE